MSGLFSRDLKLKASEGDDYSAEEQQEFVEESYAPVEIEIPAEPEPAPAPEPEPEPEPAPVAEEKPAEQEAVQAETKETPAEEEVEVAAEPEEEESELFVTAFIKNPQEEYFFGDRMTLSADVEGLNGKTCQFQWQCKNRDGGDWKDISGATERDYSFELDENTANLDYRVKVVG